MLTEKEQSIFGPFEIFNYVGGGTKDPATIVQTRYPLTASKISEASAAGWVLSTVTHEPNQFFKPSKEPNGSVIMYLYKEGLRLYKNMTETKTCCQH